MDFGHDRLLTEVYRGNFAVKTVSVCMWLGDRSFAVAGFCAWNKLFYLITLLTDIVSALVGLGTYVALILTFYRAMLAQSAVMRQ